MCTARFTHAVGKLQGQTPRAWATWNRCEPPGASGASHCPCSCPSSEAAGLQQVRASGLCLCRHLLPAQQPGLLRDAQGQAQLGGPGGTSLPSVKRKSCHENEQPYQLWW